MSRNNSFPFLLVLSFLCLSFFPPFHSEISVETSSPTSLPEIISPESLLIHAKNITYRWRHKVDFASQPAVLNIWTRFHVFQQDQDEYHVLQRTRVSWQNRDFLALEKDGRTPVIDWKTFGNVLDDPMCQSSPHGVMFQKVLLEVGLEKDRVEQFCRNVARDAAGCLVKDWQCGQVDALLRLNTTGSEQAPLPQQFLFRSMPSMPEHWKVTQNQDLKVTYYYQDDYVNALEDRADLVMRRVRMNGGMHIAEDFRERVTQNQKQTVFEYDTLLHFRNVNRVYLPLGFALKWYGFSNRLDKPLEARAEWRTSSNLDVPLQQIIESPHKFEHDRTFAPEANVVDQPMVLNPSILQCDKREGK